MRFIDEVTLDVAAGDGGDGAIAFMHSRQNPRGGPSGGDGGDGGSVILEADPGLGTLLDLHFKKHLTAARGQHGMGKDMYGRGGDDVVQRVPVGTVVYDEAAGELIADLTAPGQRAVIAQGGRGGRGNMHFATPSNQTPEKATPGTLGEIRRVRVELKLLADVGIVGFPNVGKSTLIARISRARPKIADYPFTTLVPNLGVAAWRDGQSFVVADMPGLIEGAHAGHGLGDRFLRHVERCRCFLHVVTVEPDDPVRAPARDLALIREELRLYDAELASRPIVVGLSKMDLPHVREAEPALRARLAAEGLGLHPFSAATGEGIPGLLDALGTLVVAARLAPDTQKTSDPPAGNRP